MSMLTSFSAVSFPLLLGLFALAFAGGCDRGNTAREKAPVADNNGDRKFLVLDPGHFHAALVFKPSGYAGISPSVGVYAPVGEDIAEFLNLAAPFNSRAEDPSNWRYDIHLGPDFREALLKEKPGGIVVLSGRNNEKIDRMLACLNAGFNVLADKPWIIDSSKFALLDSALAVAEKRKLAAYDIMTERYEITTIIQRRMIADTALFGEIAPGTPENPSVVKRSVHNISKVVAGKQLKRPAWFFDTAIQGEGLVDVTTHLVDLVFWTLFPEQAMDYHKDINMTSARHWPTVLTSAQFGEVTGKSKFPDGFALDSKGDLPYFCNGQMRFKVKGVNVEVQVEWNFKAPEGGGDTHYSIIRGTKVNVLVQQGKEQNYRPEVYIEPAAGANRAEVGKALAALIASLAAKDYPGLTVKEEKGRWRIDIPQQLRVGHESHFGQVAAQYLKYVGGEPMPAWERPNMLAKYFVTTKALEMSKGK